MSRQPKLRWSCDECGTAKVKCDHGQPECGRCVAHGHTCVYGVSRKMGKPPSDKRRAATLKRLTTYYHEGADFSSSTLKHPAASSAYPAQLYGCTPPSSALAVGPELPPQAPYAALLPGDPDLSSCTWGPIDDQADDFIVDMGPLDSIAGSLADASAQVTMNLPDWGLLGASDPLSPPLTQCLSPANRDSSRGSQGPRASSSQGAAGQHHNCLHEAYSILATQSALIPLALCDCPVADRKPNPGSPDYTLSGLPHSHGSSSLAQVLRLNRDSAERLGLLLTCACANSPRHLLLHAAIIHGILDRYQQAADFSHGDGSSEDQHASANATAAAGPHSVTSAPPSIPLPAQLTPPHNGNDDGSPDKLVFGSFSVDDHLVEAALKLQLLSGELRRSAALIDLFAPHSDTSSGPVDGIGGLHHHLHTWLVSEHKKGMDFTRLRLGELNA